MASWASTARLSSIEAMSEDAETADTPIEPPPASQREFEGTFARWARGVRARLTLRGVLPAESAPTALRTAPPAKACAATSSAQPPLLVGRRGGD